MSHAARYLSEKDIEYICFSMDSHVELLKEGLSTPLNGSIKEEMSTNYKLIDKIGQQQPLSKPEYWDLYYVMSERADWVTEGKGLPYEGFNAANDAGKTSRILKKLGKLFGLTNEEILEGPPLPAQASY